MNLKDMMGRVSHIFGSDNSFFHGPRSASQKNAEAPASDPNAFSSATFQQQANAQPQQYASPQQYAPQMQYAPPQQYSPMQQNAQNQQYVQPPYAQPQPYIQPPYSAQQQAYSQQYPPQQYAAQNQDPYQQYANQPYVQPRNRRSSREAENVVPFPNGKAEPAAAFPQPQTQPPVQPPVQPSSAVNAVCIINIHGLAECQKAISILRSGDCVIGVIDGIPDQAEMRRYVDTLNGACFSLGCTMTRLSAKFSVYILAPNAVRVFADQTTSAMNAQARTPQRPRSTQAAYQQSSAAYRQYAQPYQQQNDFQSSGYQTAQPYAQAYAPAEAPDYMSRTGAAYAPQGTDEAMQAPYGYASDPGVQEAESV